MDGLIDQANHTYISPSVAQSHVCLPLDAEVQKTNVTGGFKLDEASTRISFKLSFKRDVRILWKNAEGSQKMRIKVISLVVNERIKALQMCGH